ncbi:hypothetical protein [Altericista sp. CCNU0014]
MFWLWRAIAFRGLGRSQFSEVGFVGGDRILVKLLKYDHKVTTFLL